MEQWLPELKVAVQDAQKCLDDCKTVRGMVIRRKFLIVFAWWKFEIGTRKHIFILYSCAPKFECYLWGW